MHQKKQEAEKENNERWLITYADLITLLLIFFIVLYSMSQINAKKFDELSQSMAIIFGSTGRSGVLDGGRTVVPDPSTHKEKRNITSTKERVKRMIARMGLDGKITVRKDGRGLVISVQDTVFFKKGSADLNDKANEIVGTVGKMLETMPNSIRIEGHTDNIKIHNARYYSNWELSTARATNVLHSLIEQTHIAPERLAASGYAEFKPVASNKTELGRSFNRRVDIVVLNEEDEELEPSGIIDSTGNPIGKSDEHASHSTNDIQKTDRFASDEKQETEKSDLQASHF
jgi:chemotaxis protein MotB